MKALERQTAGYSQEGLETFLRSTLFPSAFFDQPVPVRGICFAAGIESATLARQFAEDWLALGTVRFRIEALTPDEWCDLSRLLAPPKAEVSKVGFLLPNLDLAPVEVQEEVAETVLAGETPLWFATARDQQRLIPPLKLAFLVYLGLGSNGCMRFLCQDGQSLLIDEGSLKKAPRHSTN